MCWAVFAKAGKTGTGVPDLFGWPKGADGQLPNAKPVAGMHIRQSVRNPAQR